MTAPLSPCGALSGKLKPFENHYLVLLIVLKRSLFFRSMFSRHFSTSRTTAVDLLRHYENLNDPHFFRQSFQDISSTAGRVLLRQALPSTILSRFDNSRGVRVHTHTHAHTLHVEHDPRHKVLNSKIYITCGPFRPSRAHDFSSDTTLTGIPLALLSVVLYSFHIRVSRLLS